MSYSPAKSTWLELRKGMRQFTSMVNVIEAAAFSAHAALLMITSGQLTFLGFIDTGTISTISHFPGYRKLHDTTERNARPRPDKLGGVGE